jgi:hypothetical protein
MQRHGAVRKTEEAMLERSHWRLAAAVILIGTMIPFAVNETFGSEPDAGFVFFIWCALAAAVVAAGYGIWVATRHLLGTTRRVNPDDPEHPGWASGPLSGWFARTDIPKQ